MAEISSSPEWASFLVTRRVAIDRALLEENGPLTRAGESEREALRRFRSFAASALRRGGEVPEPALDGLRVDPARAQELVEAWCTAAGEEAGGQGATLRGALAPLVQRFGESLRSNQLTEPAKRARSPRRRAVIGAIDRIADLFLAIDLESLEIADANPAAAAALGVERVELLGQPAERFVHKDTHDVLRERIASVAEGGEGERFRLILRDTFERPIAVEVCATPYPGRRHRLALFSARPVVDFAR